MREFGAVVHRDGTHFDIAPTGYTARTHTIEPDASTSSYFFAAAALTGNRVTVPGLGSGSLQGDTDFVRVLALMGAHVEIGEDAITVAGTGRLRGIEVNMRDISDTMPTPAAIAPFADGPVCITDVYNTRVKESDRLDACAENLRRLGVPVTEGRDWIAISPALPRPAVIDCRDDHRIAMSFGITGLLTPGSKGALRSGLGLGVRATAQSDRSALRCHPTGGRYGSSERGTVRSAALSRLCKDGGRAALRLRDHPIRLRRLR